MKSTNHLSRPTWTIRQSEHRQMFLLVHTKYMVETRNVGHPHMTDSFVLGNGSEKYLARSYTSLLAQWLTASYDPSKCK